MFVKNGFDITICCNLEAEPFGLRQPELFSFPKPYTGAGERWSRQRFSYVWHLDGMSMYV